MRLRVPELLEEHKMSAYGRPRVGRGVTAYGWRSRAGLLLRQRPWIMPASMLAASIAFGWVLLSRPASLATFATAAGFALTAFAWGYAQRARRSWPMLAHLNRRQYRETWDILAGSTVQDASFSAANQPNESQLRASAAEPIGHLVELAGLIATDDVLEIACGVGRVGRELAPRCRSWTGADISGKMLAAAAARTSHLPNVQLHQLDGHGLRGLASDSFDVVYCTNAIGHIDDYDRWRYVEDAFRVLRPGGRLMIDNLDLNSDVGWNAFLKGWSRFEDHEAPPYVGRYSSADELTRYYRRAGFDCIEAHSRSPLVIATGIKPGRKDSHPGRFAR